MLVIDSRNWLYVPPGPKCGDPTTCVVHGCLFKILSGSRFSSSACEGDVEFFFFF